MPQPRDMTIGAFSKWVLAELQRYHGDIPHVDIEGPITCNCRSCDKGVRTNYHLEVGLKDGRYEAHATINGCSVAHARETDLLAALDVLTVRLSTAKPRGAR